MKIPLILAAILFAQQGQATLRSLYKDSNKLFSAPVNGDVGDPLILTPFLQEGRIEEAQQAALVQNSNFLNVTSYAGYFTVDDRFDSNLWFWFFPSADNMSSDPVVLWLNGGPGASSLNGLFDENGPFIVDVNGKVSLRDYSWHRNQSLLFIDNPVGVGFSFTNGGLAKNETKVGEDMYSGLSQFFQLFPQLYQNDFFISGESYAGKYLPAIGYTILKKNPEAKLKINLQGILIGDGWTDPINQLNYGPFVYNTGLVSAAIKDEIDEHRANAIAAIQKDDFEGALSYWTEITSVIQENSGVSIYNYLGSTDQDGDWPTFLNTEDIRKAIHVGNTQYGDKGAGSALDDDMLRSIAPWVEELLENYRILVYTGQVDIIVGYPMVLDYLKELNFTGVEDYRSAARNKWFVADEIAGYVRTGGNLTELLVRNAGHMVPSDQPKWAYDMLYRFTRYQTYA